MIEAKVKSNANYELLISLILQVASVHYYFKSKSVVSQENSLNLTKLLL